MHNLRAKTVRDGSVADYVGSAELSSPEPDVYDIQGHLLPPAVPVGAATSSPVDPERAKSQLSRRSLWLAWCRCCRCIGLRFGSLGIRFCWRWVRLRLGLGIWLRFRLRRDADQLYLKDQR